MKEYYQQRAPVYDRVYSYPERQNDLRELEQYIPAQFAGLDIVEVAAGTGYWTQFICKKAKSILSTDITPEALVQINRRTGDMQNVTTRIVDAYSLDPVELNANRRFNGAFAGLWYSHIPVRGIPKFYQSLHGRLAPGATVVFIDNSSAQCDRLPLSHTDQDGNTYQDRELDDGTVHRVLKNFPTEKQLIEAASSYGENFVYIEYQNFWLFQYTAV